MKTRLVTIAILLLMLTVLLSRNDARITDTLLNIINPIKQSYKNLTQNLEDKSHSYIFQITPQDLPALEEQGVEYLFFGTKIIIE